MQCAQAQSLITPYLEKSLPLAKKAELVRHIRSCKQCREELEFYLVVYVTTDMIDDENIPEDDYSKAVEELLCQTEREEVRAQHQARTGRFRLITILLLLGIALSISVGRSAVDLEPQKQEIRTDGFYLGDLFLPEEIDFVNSMIAAQDDAARDFVFSRRLREQTVTGLWKKDVEMMRALRDNAELTYPLPESFLACEGSFAKRLEAAKLPDIVVQPRITLYYFER